MACAGRFRIAISGARGLPVTEAQRAGILACADSAQLEGWLRKTVRVEKAGELFG